MEERKRHASTSDKTAPIAPTALESNTTAPKKEEPVQFLQIPPEIRVEVYKHLLCSRNQVIWRANILPDGTYFPALIWCRRLIIATPKPYDHGSGKVMRDRPFYHRMGREQAPNANILRTCRTIYTEAIPHLYRDNEFGFEDDFIASRFLRHIGFANRRLICSIAVGWYWTGHRPDTFAGMKTILKSPGQPHAEFMQQVLLATYFTEGTARRERMYDQARPGVVIGHQVLLMRDNTTSMYVGMLKFGSQMDGLKEVRLQVDDGLVKKTLNRQRKEAQQRSNPKRYWPRQDRMLRL